MLETLFRNGADRRQVQDDLRALLSQSSAERTAMRAVLDQAGGASEKLARIGRELDELRRKADGAVQKVDRLSGAVAGAEERAARFAALEKRVDELFAQVAEAKRSAQAHKIPDAELQRYRQAAEDLNHQTRLAETALGALRQEGQKHEQLHEQLRASSADVEQTTHGAAALKGELEALRATEADLRQEMNAVREIAREALGDSAAATTAVKEVAAKFDSLTPLHELSRDTERRLASLNALAEHVTHKLKTLEAQKQTVEHAVVEATRLNEMVWAMDAQIARLAEGREQMQRAEEAAARIEQLAKTSTQDLAAATAARDDFLRESVRLEARGRALADHLRVAVDQLSIDKKEFDTFDQRLESLSAALGQTEGRVQDVLARDEAFAGMQQRADALAKSFGAMRAEADDLARKQAGLAALADQLGQVDALGKRTAAQHESLLQSQQELDAVRRELAAFNQAHAAALQLRDRLALDRTALEAFAERTATMLSRVPEIETRLQAVLGKLALVDEGNHAAAKLADVAAGLDSQLTRLAARQQFVETLDERVNGLHVVTAEVERKLADQLARRAEVESLRSLCDTLVTQVADVQQKLEGVSGLQGRLLPVAQQVSTLMQTLQESQRLADAMTIDEATVQEQQARLTELVEQGRQQAAATAARLAQVQSASDDLGRAATLKEELLAELTRVQARQRDAVSQIDLADDLLRRAETLARQLEQRHTQLQHSEKTIAGFEQRIAELDRSSERVDQKIKSLAERDALVQAVRDEVDHIRQISGRSRADLQFVTEHRHEVAELRTQLEQLDARASDTQDKITLIESQRKTVEDVQARAADITHMLGDLHLNLEMLSGQRAVVDDVGERLARLDYTVQEAQNTLRALQREREVAERIEQGIKALRTRSNAASTA